MTQPDNDGFRGASQGADDKTHEWRQYQIIVDLHKTHLDLLIRLNIFYYATTGGIVSYVLAHSSVPYIGWALTLPAVMSLGLTVLLWFAAKASDVADGEASRLAREIGLRASLEGALLSRLLRLVAGLFALVGVGCAVLGFSI